MKKFIFTLLLLGAATQVNAQVVVQSNAEYYQKQLQIATADNFKSIAITTIGTVNVGPYLVQQTVTAPTATTFFNLKEITFAPTGSLTSYNYRGDAIVYTIPSTTSTSYTNGSHILRYSYLQDLRTGAGGFSSGTNDTSIITIAGTGTYSTLSGDVHSSTISGAAAITTWRGRNSTLTFSGAGTLGDAIHYQANSNYTNASTVVTSHFGFYHANLSNSGTITNTYGFYVGDITAGTQTNTPYSYYASDESAYNYLGGRTISPAYYVGTAGSNSAGVDCTGAPSSITVTKGIVTACTASSPSLQDQIDLLKAEIQELKNLLLRKNQ